MYRACKTSALDLTVVSQAVRTAMGSYRIHQQETQTIDKPRIRGAFWDVPSRRTELVVMCCANLSLIELTTAWIEGSKNSETWALHIWVFTSQFADGAVEGLPRQGESPSLDSTSGIVIPRRAEFDMLGCLVVGKYPLHPLVELLGECRQVIGIVKFRILPLF